MNKPILIKQHTSASTRKQNFNLLGSQLTTVGMVVFAIAAPEVYSRIPPEYLGGLGASVAGIVGFAVGYAVRERA